MQEFSALNMTENAVTAIQKMQKSIESAASSFSGTAFPTENLQVGMLCMRTDLHNNIYKLTSLDPVTWEQVGVASKTASKLESKRTIKLTGKAVGSTTTDLSGDVAIEVKAVTADTAKTADSATNATNADNAKKAVSATTADTATKAVSATNATNATKLDHDVNINLTGAVTGSATTNLADGTLNLKMAGNANQFKNITVSGSQQRLKYIDVETTRAGDGIDSSWTEGIGDLSTQYRRYECSANEFPAGTYSLQDILQRLVNACHRHYVRGITVKGNCNCNCNCDCGGTCFVKGTFVLMADGTWKTIESVRVGEYVKGMTGINRVEGLDRTILGERRSVYTFPDKTLYFSGEHNMWVRKGNDEFFGVVDITQHLREKDPSLFPELVGYTLKRDVIVIDRPVDFATIYGWKRENPIIAREYGNLTPLYCLILDGDHTMFVNGYLAGGFPHDDDFSYEGIHWKGNGKWSREK